jgi:hypothetical protein
MQISFSRTTATALFGLLALTACSSTPKTQFTQELFQTGASPYARNFNASTNDSCEAARRALLSQGYLTTMSRPDSVDGTKNFQPNGDTHLVVEFHVVCTPGEETADTSIVYVNAVQNGFALKKSDTSASVGLSVRTQPVTSSLIETRTLPMQVATPLQITTPEPVPEPVLPAAPAAVRAATTAPLQSAMSAPIQLTPAPVIAIPPVMAQAAPAAPAPVQLTAPAPIPLGAPSPIIEPVDPIGQAAAAEPASGTALVP